MLGTGLWQQVGQARQGQIPQAGGGLVEDQHQVQELDAGQDVGAEAPSSGKEPRRLTVSTIYAARGRLIDRVSGGGRSGLVGVVG